ncbi:TonB-dependent receptor [Herbaspirillum lusitanum]|uniref:TonB-dependent receptor n=1 Tax=Herbaspirillum lusitanum TaxID=213312 RepID=A0ABW9AEB8_9BURK
MKTIARPCRRPAPLHPANPRNQVYPQRKLLLCLLAGALLCGTAFPVLAQQSEAGAAASSSSTTAAALPALTVTANKQEQTLEAVPASITVFDGETLRETHAGSIEALEQMTPGLSFQPFGQSGVHSPVVRGMTANFFSFSTSTLLLVDGVPTLMAQGFDNNLLGVERVEVLRGPQGTLYGRNAEAGVINICSLAPDNTPRSMISAGAGSRNLRSLSVELSRPLVQDTLYASIAAEWRKQDGFIDNRNRGGKEDGHESTDLKLALRWTPSARTDATLRYSRSDQDDGGSLWGAPSAERATVRSGTPSWNHSSGSTLSLNVAHELDSGLRLRSITAWNEWFDHVQQDTDFLPADTLHIGRDHRFTTLSQELRLEGKLGQATWLAGAYADHDDHHLVNEQKLPLALSVSRASQTGDSAALFTDWSIPLAERWTLAAGARAERDSVRFTPQGSSQRSASWTRFSPKLSLQYQWAKEQQIYAGVTDGFRAGGYNVFVPAAGYAAYQPETVRSYELGGKGWLWQKRLRYSAAAYLMNVRNMQVQQMPTAGVVYITNAASARSGGVELELDYLLGGGWQLRSGLAYNRTRFDRFRDGSNVYDGHRNPFAPDLSGHLTLRYDAPSSWYAQVSLNATGKVYLDAANRYSRNGYGLLNVSGGYRIGQTEISAYINNLANRRYDAVGYQNGIVTVYSPPREAGLRLTWRM